MKIEVEPFATVEKELLPLLQQHYNEVNGTDPLLVDVRILKEMDFFSRLLIVSVRDEEGNLVGYTLTVIQKHPRHDLNMSDTKAIYLKDECRGFTAFELMGVTEAELRKRRVDVAYQSFKVKNPLMNFFAALGYEADTVVVKKRL